MADDLIKQNVEKNRLAKTPDEILKSVQALNDAKEKIKQKIIESDKSSDNSVLYTAITKFGKTNV
jgi:hypothetical protein